MTALLLAAALAACASDRNLPIGEIGFVDGFFGGVVVDEPRAAQIGRDVLAAGGSAADSAVAIGMALSVTYPSAASLGGGGVCVVHDPTAKKTEALEFPAHAPTTIPSGVTRPNAVPANPRGFYALHSRYGRLEWAQLVAPAEQLARFGNVVSRSFARKLQSVGPALLQDMDSRRIFINPAGTGVVGEGDRLVQVDLASTLAGLRRLGPGEFYSGPFARRLVTAAAEAGGHLSLEDLRKTTPRWRETLQVPLGNQILHFPPPPAAAGLVEAELMAILTTIRPYVAAPEAERPHLLAETFKRVFADRQKWRIAESMPEGRLQGAALNAIMAGYRSDTATPADRLGLPPQLPPENPAATTFVVVDREGAAVVCGLTMNNIFGIGRVARGTGIMLAAVPGQYGGGPISLGPVLMVNPFTNRLYLAAGASGGALAPTTLVQVLLGVLSEDKPLEEVMLRKRIHHGGRPDLVYFEQGLEEAQIRSLTERGHRVAATPALGQVNAIQCKRGVPFTETSVTDICSLRADPRGAGIALGAN